MDGVVAEYLTNLLNPFPSANSVLTNFLQLVETGEKNMNPAACCTHQLAYLSVSATIVIHDGVVAEYLTNLLTPTQFSVETFP
jgi:hypothetical protein